VLAERSGTCPRYRVATSCRGKLGSLVVQMLKLHKDLSKARTAPDKTAIVRQIVATDKQIDQLVYELHGLMEEGIRVSWGGQR
jgi:hypothetical protein